MVKMIDVRDLSDKDVEFIEQLVKRLRSRARNKRKEEESEKPEITFAAWPLGVREKLSIKKIYG